MQITCSYLVMELRVCKMPAISDARFCWAYELFEL